ncbi:hypothetical protein [Pseudomonas sp. BN415]|uniref:hypothetical protein n=1 Tax=Pseudomonas sp. BN415 TaxID=2567889 RepID=UPI002455A6BF|nr:hypothetical protein [Pseudomonas sp. BN415]
MANPTLGKIATAGLEHPHLCDECGKARNRGNHQACAKKRQARYRKEAAHA